MNVRTEALRILSLLFLATAIALVVQCFQWSLEWTLALHNVFPFLILALPVAWIFFWLTSIKGLARDFESTDQVLRELKNPQRRISPFLAPLIWIRTLWSHMFGASIGREGTALQIAGSLSDTLAAFLKFGADQRQAFLRAAMAAGLAAAYRAPWAGFIFALELGGATSRRLRAEALLASWVAFSVVLFLEPLAIFELPEIDFAWSVLIEPMFWVVTAGLILFSPIYRILFLAFNRALRGLPSYLRWPIGGSLGLLFLYLWQDPSLKNIGGPLIEHAFSEPLDSWLFLKKTFLTAIFTATGWFGGDFTPNMAAGAAAGNTFSAWSGFSMPVLGAALGFFLPVAFTHRILATGWVLTLEAFGWKVALLAIPVFAGAYLFGRILEPIFKKLHHP